MMRLQTCLGFLILSCWSFVWNVESAGLKEEFSWSSISFTWPANRNMCGVSEGKSVGGKRAGDGLNVPYRTRIGEAKKSSEYILENNVPMGATRYKNKVFVSIPRRRPGIPATLSYVSLDCKNRHNVPLIPYPNPELNSLSTYRSFDPTNVNTHLVNVYRTTVDACDRLWMVDMGTLEYPNGRDQVQQFAIVVIDLKTDKVIRRYPFKVDEVTAESTLATITVDVTKDTCDNAFAYIPDLVNYKMLVYSWKENDSWRVAHNYFHMNPLEGDFDVGGHKFMWDDGIFSIALSKTHKDGYRTAYFHSFASSYEFSVSTRILRNRTLATRSYHNKDFRLEGSRGKNGQTATHDLHAESGLMFHPVVDRDGVYCWNIHHKLTPENLGLVQADPEKMVYPSDIKVDQEDNLWVITNTMPQFQYGRMNFDEVNFRIWSNNVYDAVRGTPCARKY